MASIHAVMAAWKLGGRDAVREMGVYLPEEGYLNKLVMEAIGAASMCWDNVYGAGVFQPEKAAKIGQDLIEAVIKEIVAAQLAKGNHG